VLLTGLILVGISTYESQTAPDDGGGFTTSLAEDGTGFPPPHP
jgi:hypothetical protein